MDNDAVIRIDLGEVFLRVDQYLGEFRHVPGGPAGVLAGEFLQFRRIGIIGGGTTAPSAVPTATSFSSPYSFHIPNDMVMILYRSET